MLSSVQYEYALLCVFTLVVIMIVCIVGVAQTFRPGLPTISRMLADDYSLFSFFYFGVIVLIYVLRTTIVLGASKNTNLTRFRGIVGYIQSISLLYVYVASVDYMPAVHSVVACLVVVTTILRDLTFINLRGCLWDMVDMLHLFVMIQFIVLAMVFIILMFTIPDLERTTDFALVEYMLFLTIPQLQIFNIRSMAITTS